MINSYCKLPETGEFFMAGNRYSMGPKGILAEEEKKNMPNPFDDIVNEIKAATKNMGYKKRRLVWHKVQDRLTIMFSIQKSLYSPDVWYYRFGICLHDIASGSIFSMDSCQIMFRLDHTYENRVIEAQKVINLIDRWETMYGNRKLLRRCAIEGRLSGQCTAAALKYLTSNLWENGVF